MADFRSSIDKKRSASDIVDSPVDGKSIDIAEPDDLVDREPPPLRWTNYLFGNRSRPAYNPDSIATRRSVYDDPNLAAHYWPKQEYENLHRFDPKARWTYREEQGQNVLHQSSDRLKFNWQLTTHR
ncbi:hypothetical protein C8J56DRAFT_1157733 [Mycena floridula]|nr:hypothetical protein C8J56DRAFT_1157733 [Mycena floridula]